MRGDALPLGTILPMSRGSGDIMGNMRHHAPPRAGGLPGSHAPQPAGLGLGGVGRARGWGLMFLAHFLSFSLPLPMLGKAMVQLDKRPPLLYNTSVASSPACITYSSSGNT
jgi:hypothetical protein